MNECHFNESFEKVDELKAIVVKHANVLFNKFDSEGLKVDPMDIEIQPNCQLKMQPSRFIKNDLMSKVKSELDKLEEWGVISKIDDAETASPLVIVKKPDGNIRLAVDYRELNAVIKPTANQLPYQKLLFSTLANQKYFAKIDNLYGYYQLGLTERAKKYCSIITPWGLYQMNMLGFGVATAPGIYQQRMAGPILGQFYLNGAVVYIDDTIIYGSTMSEFLERLDMVLGRLAEMNVRLKPSKCYFGYPEVVFLGHTFHENGYSLCDDYKVSVNNMEIPESMTKLKGFLGLVNYFRDFVPNLSTIVAPLSDLTKGNRRTIEWNEKADSAFIDVKRAISQCSTLSWLVPNDPIILYTDASTVGIGACLVQVQNGEEKPIMFVSKKFSEAASNWSTIEQECFAIFYACIQLQSFLLGRKFFIKTDHKNLVYLSSSSVPKVIRWRLRLLEFDFVVIHIPGSENVAADYLSRIYSVVHEAENILSEDEQQNILSMYHNDIIGHHGISKTYSLLKSKGYNWSGMKADISVFIKNCIYCQKVKRGELASDAEIHHLHGDYPMASLSADVIGPLPEDKYGNKYILVIIDNFSKFTNLYAIGYNTSQAFAQCLISHIGVFRFRSI
ncbi:MAG: hypothetical protein HC836_46865 [Richelia sp. RM2_1_2]|nr:hypothetical protein [Richelia sp. RM2_1_2]